MQSSFRLNFFRHSWHCSFNTCSTNIPRIQNFYFCLYESFIISPIKFSKILPTSKRAYMLFQIYIKFAEISERAWWKLAFNNSLQNLWQLSHLATGCISINLWCSCRASVYLKTRSVNSLWSVYKITTLISNIKSIKYLVLKAFTPPVAPHPV